MAEIHPIVWFIELLIFLLGVAIGHSFLLLKIRREENRNRELELSLLEKRAQDRRVSSDIEEALYNAQVRKEIDDILRKN